MAFLDQSWMTYRPAEGFYSSKVEVHRPLPVRTFLPFGYEPRYAYPLVVFFHGEGSNEKQILRLAPRLSRRNFISIGLRGPVSLGEDVKEKRGYSWGGPAHLELVEEYMVRAVQQTRLKYHVHSERIYLAGFAEGATMAYRMALASPDKIAGVVSLNGCMPRHSRPLLRMPEVRDLRAWIGHGIANSVVPLSLAREDHRLLWSAGLDAEMQTYPTTHRLHADMLRDLNRWIVGHCNDQAA